MPSILRQLSMISFGVQSYLTPTAFPERFHHVQPDFYANVQLACVTGAG